MRYILILLIVVCIGLCYSLPILKPSATPQQQITAVQGLIARKLGPHYVKQFDLQIVSSSDGLHDEFKLSNGPSGTISIQGTTGVGLSSGLYWYLRYYCNCSVTWGDHSSGDNLVVPNPLPTLPAPVANRSPVLYRYYLNTCTFSYSAAWWNWSRWESEIDWMALHGINLPLSFTGQEYVFTEMFKSFGLQESDLDAFFAGPAFLAWGRMGNIQGWGGPLFSSWKLKQFQLQKLILARQRELGMIPVLPGFAGFVPDTFQKYFPSANITRSADWANFPSNYSEVYLLQPLDPMFKQLGAKFIATQTELLGTDHVYNADTFNEMVPSSGDPAFLKATSKAVFEGLTASDPKAVWMIQGWMFFFDQSFWTIPRIEDYLSSIPDDNMIILELNSDTQTEWPETHSYFGKGWVWCMLHNFGGEKGIYGNLTHISVAPLETIKVPDITVIGTGLTMEGIEQNPIMYELMAEIGWRDNYFDLTQWINSYTSSRYGENTPSIISAWKNLYIGSYSVNSFARSLIIVQPGFGFSSKGNPTNATLTFSAFKDLIMSLNELKTLTPPFKYDLVDVSRQIVSNMFFDLYAVYISVYNSKSFDTWSDKVNTLTIVSNELLGLIDDMETVLGTNQNFLLGRWIETALSWGDTDDERKLLNFNAKNQLTLWGPNGQISNYAAKQWNGIVGSLYKGNWQMFINMALDSVKNNASFDQNKFNKDSFDFQWNWNNQMTSYPVNEVGDSVQEAKKIYQKFAEVKGFKKMEGYDAPGNDILETWSKDAGNMAWVCSLDSECKGFNSFGLLKSSVQGTVANSAATLYVKL